MRCFLESLEPRLVLSAYGFSTLASFAGSDGTGPTTLVRDADGNLFGTVGVSAGPPTAWLFEVPVGSGRIVDVAPFDASIGTLPSVGYFPRDLIIDGSGNLFGVAERGGANDDGTVFELAKGSTTLTVLASFNGFDGWGPDKLLLDDQGNLYGTTEWGGPGFNPGGSDYRDGTVFEVVKGSGVITDLAYFSGTDGYVPNSLAIDANGNVFGTTRQGGPDFDPPHQQVGNGTVFEIVRGSGRVTDLAPFNGSNGMNPNSILLDGSGNLYGLTSGGGARLTGVFFELARGSGTITDLTTFNYPADGAGPANLLVDRFGNYYGVTRAVGQAGQGGGTVFEIPAGTSSVVTLATINQYPVTPDSLVLDAAGNLYGVTGIGGANFAGSVFQVTASPTNVALTAGTDSVTFRQDADHLHIDWTLGSQSGQVLISDPAGLLLTGNGSNDALMLDPSGGSPLPDALRLNGTFTLKGNLALGAQQTIDLRGGSLSIPYSGATPLPAIQSDLRSGQIFSSTAAAGFAVADVDSGSAITLSLRLRGDTNADGSVAFSDLLLLAQHYNAANSDWAYGDFNYDGTVGFSDLLILAQEYGRTAGTRLLAAALPTPSGDGGFDFLIKRRRAKG